MNAFFARTGRYIFTACLLSASSLPAIAGDQKNEGITNANLESLDKSLHQFSSRFYTKLVRTDNSSKADSIGALVQTIDRYQEQNQWVSATAAIINNMALVEQNIDTTPIIKICSVLFEANEWNTASLLYKKVKKQGDKSLVSNVSLSLAKYYFSRNQWQETIGIVDSISSDLPPEDYHNALLVRGISLQRLQKHRTALEQYTKIPPGSRYYVAARLNMAIANIRQDWWTDAHTIINDLLNDKGLASDDELTDRLYIVLGYSLIQQQYYRNSRDAFRNVRLDGKYTNKALLGLALTAAYQEDYVGALNAIKVLKASKTRDLPVDEANLLLPYFYERLKQLSTASAGYIEAIKYYEVRAQDIKAAMSGDSDALMKQVVSGNSSIVTINGEYLDLGEKLPRFIFDNIRILTQFQPHVARIGDAALVREYEALNAAYRSTLQKTAQGRLVERSSHLSHYMNQSRYGLARMQDYEATAPK